MPIATILLGLPGSGKSTWCARNSSPRTVVCSADHYFNLNGRYQFDPSKLPEAHAACLRAFITSCQLKLSVVVDNTNCSLAQVAPYVVVAQAYGCDTRVLLLEAPDAFERQVHAVPLVSWQRMRKSLDEMISNWPVFWPELERG